MEPERNKWNKIETDRNRYGQMEKKIETERNMESVGKIERYIRLKRYRDG